MVRKKNIKNTQIDPGNAFISKGCLLLTKLFSGNPVGKETEHDFLGPFSKKFPRATEFLKR